MKSIDPNYFKIESLEGKNVLMKYRSKSQRSGVLSGHHCLLFAVIHQLPQKIFPQSGPKHARMILVRASPHPKQERERKNRDLPQVIAMLILIEYMCPEGQCC